MLPLSLVWLKSLIPVPANQAILNHIRLPLSLPNRLLVNSLGFNPNAWRKLAWLKKQSRGMVR